MVAELTVNMLYKTFQVNHREIPVFEAIDFSVARGVFITIVGPSGCGKSTLLRCIAGFENPTSGSILVAGKPARRPGCDRMVVFQSFEQLFPWLTVLKNITYALRVTKTCHDQKSCKDTARKYLNLVGLSGYEDFYPYQLSGGMKQRVAIARSLAVQPRILLMDEPFGSLDAFNRSILQEELLRIWQETAVTILFVTHSIEESILLSDQIIIFDSEPGRIKAIIANNLARPRSPESLEFSELWGTLNQMLGLRRKTITETQPRHRTIFDEAEIIQPVL